jgi:hypothetical protein
MKSIFILLTLVFFLVTSCASNVKVTGHHFFDSNGQPMAQFDHLWPKLNQYFPEGCPEKVTIELIDGSHSRFSTSNNHVLISRNMFASRADSLIAHETAHSCLSGLTRKASTLEQFRFFDEGYASIVEADVAGDLAEYKNLEVFSIAARERKAGNLKFSVVQKWSVYFGDPNMKRHPIAYPVGASFDFMILDNFGEQKLIDFFRDIALTRDLARSCENIFHQSVDNIEQLWMAYLKNVPDPIAPVVEKMVPAYGANAVPTKLSEFIIRFNVPMHKERIAFVSSAPELNYKNASWRDSKTLVIKATGDLKQHFAYRGSIGSEKYGHMKSKSGLELPIKEWSFITQ